MSDGKKMPQTIQIRISDKLPPNVYRWAKNQGTNVNEAVKTALKYFVMIYGENSLDTEEAEIRLAKDLLLLKGETLPDGGQQKSVLDLQNQYNGVQVVQKGNENVANQEQQVTKTNDQKKETIEEPVVVEKPKKKAVIDTSNISMNG